MPKPKALPRKPRERQQIISVGLPPSMLIEIDYAAALDHRSRNSQIVAWLSTCLESWRQIQRIRGAV